MPPSASEEEAFGSGDNGFGAKGGMVGDGGVVVVTSPAAQLFKDANLVAYVNAPQCPTCGLTLLSDICRGCKVGPGAMTRQSSWQLNPPKKFQDFMFNF